jgi:glucuronokinase
MTTTHTASALARAGLAGHPSDGYGGATLSVTLRNWSADVTVEPAESQDVAPDGDGEHLIRAAIARFEKDVAPLPHPVRVHFKTTIPRECGLGGSSAIVIATLRALAQLSGATLDAQRLPHIALACETEDLGIAAGLQDRVVQAYGGLVFMDFTHDMHEPLDAKLLPPLFVAWDESSGGSSGTAHAGVRARFEAGDRTVTSAMSTLAQIAHDARAALLAHDHDAFAQALTAGYDVRARIFDLDPRHTAMIDAARELRLPATYTGSGGAIIGIARDAEALTELSKKLGDQQVQRALV